MAIDLSPVDFHHRVPVDVSFYASLRTLLNKQSMCQRYETPWSSYDVTLMQSFNCCEPNILITKNQLNLEHGHPWVLIARVKMDLFHKMYSWIHKLSDNSLGDWAATRLTTLLVLATPSTNSIMETRKLHYRKISNIRRSQSQNLNVSRHAVVFAKAIEPR